MSVTHRDPVGEPLPERQRTELKQWAKLAGQKTVAARFGVTVETIRKWTKGKNVSRSVYKEVCETLRRRSLNAGNAGGDDADVTTSTDQTDGNEPSRDDDSRGEVCALFEEGRQSHYGQFSPDTAMDLLAQVQHHPGLPLLERARAVDMLGASLSIYRQSARVGEWQFRSSGQACLKLLFGKSESRGRDLAAAICTAAWELIAVTVQRGWAKDGIVLLEKVDRILDERELRPHLKFGREKSMLRLWHYARVVAHEEFLEVEKNIGRDAAIIDLKTAREIGPAETNSVILQKMAECLRFSKERKRVGSVHDADDFFRAHMHPILLELNHTSRLSVHDLPPAGLSSSFTPSTALGVAFASFLFAKHVGPGDARDIVELATDVAQNIHRASEGGVMLQMMNGHARQIFNASLAVDKHRDEIAPLFRCVPYFSPSGKHQLHTIANELLGIAENLPGTL